MKALEEKIENLQTALMAIQHQNERGPPSSEHPRSVKVSDSPLTDMGRGDASYPPDSTEAIDLQGDDEESDTEESEEDPLRPSTLQAPLRSMIQAVETSRFFLHPSPQVGGKRHFNENTPSDVRRAKRLRIEDETTQQLRIMRHLLPFSRGTFTEHYLDPVDLGACSEKEGRRLFNL